MSARTPNVVRKCRRISSSQIVNEFAAKPPERARVKKASANKKTKRKYKKLDEAKAAAEGSQSVDEGESALDLTDAVSEQPPAPSQDSNSFTAEKPL